MVIREGRKLLRIIDPAFGRDNIYRFQAKKTISLGPVMVGTVANKQLTWLDVEIISENNYRGPRTSDGLPDHLALQKERKADFIGISASITNAVPRALEIIRIYCEMQAELKPQKIITGGWHAGVLPEDFLIAGADLVVHGEGEFIVILVLKGIPFKEIPGISYLRDGEIQRNLPEFITLSEEELNSLPNPDFGLVRYAKIKIYPASYGRGCSGQCRFCLVKSAHRHQSPEKFLDQMKVLTSKGVRRFFVVDDRAEEDLEGFRAWLTGLRDYCRERGIRNLDITLQCRLTLAEHPEVLKLMVEAGVHTVPIGFESPLHDQLTAMRKPISHKKMAEQARAFKKAGLYIHMMLIFGYPTSITNDPSPIKRTAKQLAKIYLRFMLKFADTAQSLFYVPIPGTEDWDELEKRDRIFLLDWSYYDGTWVVFIPDDNITPIELQKEGINLTRKYYAYKFFWRFGWLSLLLHLLKIGAVVTWIPFIWLGILPFQRSITSAWRVPVRMFRNARKHFQAHLVIMSWLNSFNRLKQKIESASKRS